VDESEISIDKVSVGSFVTVKNCKRDRVDTYKIVGSAEANSAQKRISDESPVGKALLGHKAGERVEAETPSGNIPYEILEIRRTEEN
jgi:transcription elongation factor GreA